MLLFQIWKRRRRLEWLLIRIYDFGQSQSVLAAGQDLQDFVGVDYHQLDQLADYWCDTHDLERFSVRGGHAQFRLTDTGLAKAGHLKTVRQRQLWILAGCAGVFVLGIFVAVL